MYSTIKELHIEIENEISQILSNRHYSIAPQWIDMVLNRCALRYIREITDNKSNYKREGFEDSGLRVDDIKSLKRRSGYLKVNKETDNRGYVIFPHDYLHLTSSNSKVLYSKRNIEEHSTIVTNTERYSTIGLSHFDYSNVSNWTSAYINIGSLTIDILDILKLLESDTGSDLFEVVNALIDRIGDYKIDVRWEYFDGVYRPKTLFIKSEDFVDIEILIGGIIQTVGLEYDVVEKMMSNFVESGTRDSQNDLVSAESIVGIFNNYHQNKHRHQRPVTEAIADRLYVNFGSQFIVTDIDISYIKKPKPFSYDLNQISDFTITPYFIEMVVGEILLQLKDNAYQARVQQSNLK